MFKKLSVLVAGTVLAASAQAAFLNGSLSFNGFFQTLPAVPTSSIVSGLTAFDVQSGALAGSGSGDFAGNNGSATASDWSFATLPDLVFTTAAGTVFTFTVTSIESTVVDSLECAANKCDDALTIDIVGTVSGGGYDPTVFNGSWTGQGSCSSTDNVQCTGGVTASWSASVTALGRQDIPEPGALALVGLGLAGLGLMRRRRA